jgi:hypothetical protein
MIYKITMQGSYDTYGNFTGGPSFSEMAEWCHYNLPPNSWVYSSVGIYKFLDKVAYLTFMILYART